MSEAQTIVVEVVFALAGRQKLLSVTLASGATAAEAIRQSGIAGSFPDKDFSACSIGVWGRLVEPSCLLQNGDRIEIYRPLTMQPRDARRRLAAEGKSIGGADGSSHLDPEDC